MDAVSLILKIAAFGLQIFVANTSRRQALYNSFEGFLRRSGENSKKSVQLADEYKEMEKVDPWQTEEK